MPSALEITFSSHVTLSGIAAASMQVAVDATTSEMTSIVSGSFGGVANSLSIVATSEDASAFTSGSWLGNANSLSVIDESALLSGSLTTGSYLGPANVQAVGVVELEEHSHGVASDDNPNPNEGANVVDWNPFPQEDPAPEVTQTKDRDLTRYQKAYSFTRQHPVRIRIFRR